MALDPPRGSSWLDATYVKARRDHHTASVAVIVAAGVNTDGGREGLGMAIGRSEAQPFWPELLRGLARRGLCGVRLVVSDAHEGLKAVSAALLPCFRCAGQMCLDSLGKGCSSYR